MPNIKCKPTVALPEQLFSQEETQKCHPASENPEVFSCVLHSHEYIKYPVISAQALE